MCHQRGISGSRSHPEATNGTFERSGDLGPGRTDSTRGQLLPVEIEVVAASNKLGLMGSAIAIGFDISHDLVGLSH
ncbi:MAG: hypothetical protein ACM65L_09955 [Microcoleus sp.]